ncbi:MAG: site-specific DNA-methyltransferase, partial [Spirochaetales bacterium]|nr:site-specific DNA-methyltransferase [Spirochaetales bacterium]MCF7939349.1 site-specific DNA-methyltransferase [Spirochaetales bacterium]
MYSLQEDTVLDPFPGIGTASVAGITAARNTIGYEIDGGL